MNRKSFKTLVRLILFLALLALFTSCCAVPLSLSEDEDAVLHVVTTIFPPYDFTRELSLGTGVSVVQLLKPGCESHTFDPSPKDILTVRNCDVFLCTGGESDAWVDTLLDAADNSEIKVLRMISCVDTLEEEITEGMTVHEHEDAHGHEHASSDDSDEIEYDEHVWTDPNQVMKICCKITDVLCELAPDDADIFRSNLDVYLGKLKALDERFSGIVDTAARKTVVFGDRFPFRYLCDAYGISYRAAFPGCAAESEPSAATMAFLIEKIRSEKIPVVFTIEMSNGKIAQAIAEETGAEVRMLHSCHNRTAEEAEKGKTFLELMEENADVLGEALGSDS